MKKTLAILTALLLTATLAAGCGSSDTSESSVSNLVIDAEYEVISGDFDLEECVELPEYSGIELTLTVYDISDEYIDSYISSMADTETVEDENAVVQEGDVANISYEGTIDGETFDGGSSDSYDLTIGSGTFIDGFEDGLIGMKVGEETDLELTFPEDYFNTEYAGVDVVFHVTINSISRPVEQDDDWVIEYTGGEYETMDDYREYVRDYLGETYAYEAESALYSDAWEAVFEDTVFLGVPQSYLDAGSALFDFVLEQEAATYGYSSVDEYTEALGVTEDDIESSREDYCDNYVKNRLFAEAMLEKEGIAFDGEEINAFYEETAQTYGMSVDELIEQMGEDMLYLYAVCNTANEMIVELANISEATEVI